MTGTSVSFVAAIACGVGMLFGYELGNFFIGGVAVSAVLAFIEA